MSQPCCWYDVDVASTSYGLVRAVPEWLMSVSRIGRGRCSNKLTGNTGQMVLSWLMPYFASARRLNRERTTKRHCVHTTWMWHPQRSVRAVPERLSPFPVFAYAARARAGGSLVRRRIRAARSGGIRPGQGRERADAGYEDQAAGDDVYQADRVE